MAPPFSYGVTRIQIALSNPDRGYCLSFLCLFVDCKGFSKFPFLKSTAVKMLASKSHGCFRECIVLFLKQDLSFGSFSESQQLLLW